MNRLSSIADRVARSRMAGVSVGIKDYEAKDMYWLKSQLYQALHEFGHNIDIDTDGNTSVVDYKGTLNIYIKNPEIVEKVLRKTEDFAGHFGMVGMRGKVRQDMSNSRNIPVVRVDIESNEDEKFTGLTDTSMMYSTWREILDYLGFDKVNEESGNMPIHHYLYAMKDKSYSVWPDNKLKAFAWQIADMCREALNHGYKDISWA